jgi:hypothetical protein
MIVFPPSKGSKCFHENRFAFSNNAKRRQPVAAPITAAQMIVLLLSGETTSPFERLSRK